MNNLPQPPEGILDPQVPWSRINPNSRLWIILKARLTGRPQGSENYSSYVNISEADADRLIANMKKDPRGYPSLDQTSGTPVQWMERQRIYQEWLVEEYLEKPFREQVNEKIDAKTSDVLDRVFIEGKEEVKEAETTEEVVEILEDKKEILEDIQEKISPPPNEYQIPDPWEGSYTTPQTERKKKRERRRLKRPQGVIKRPKKRPASPPGGGNEPPKPPRKRKTFVSKLGGSVRKTGNSFGKSLLDKLESGGPLGENMGPSVLGAGIWIGKKINKAFQDAKKERQRAIEAEKNGAEVPPEVKERGYFIKKSLAYQFGGETLNKTVGAFFENIPSKQSKQKSGFTDTFDYGDADPKKKKEQNDIKDLATGFRKVTTALRGINRSINQQISLMSSLVGETSRVADTLEAIQNSIAKQIDVEIQTDADEAQAQQATGGGDINIGDINLDTGGSEFDWLDALFIADDIRDIKKSIKDKGGQKTTRRKPKITGNVTPKRRFRMPSFGRRMKFSEGAAAVGTQVPALIGEAGPEMLIRGAQKKLAEGGVMQGAGSNILATGLGAAGNLMKKVQPFANVMEMPFKVIGAQISGALASLVSAAGPFSGVIAKMFSPFLGGLATIFGLNQGAFAGELNSAAMTEKQGAKELSKFFSNFFKLFGFDVGSDDEDDEDDNTQTTATGDWAPLLDVIAAGEGSYTSVNPGQTIENLTDMTVSDAWRAAKSLGESKGGTGAMGRYQLLSDPVGRARAAGLDPDKDKFSPANQDKIGAHIIENIRRGKDWREGKITDEQFGQLIANEWAGVQGPSGRGSYDGDGQNNAKVKWEKVKEALQKIKGNPTQAARGAVKPTAFLNQVQGVFEMNGPDSGYRVPEELTGGQPVIGHGLEWLIKMSNKFIILPGVNKEYNIFENPEKALGRYEQIGNQAGIEVAGLVDFIDKVLFSSPKTGKPVRYQTGPRDAIEAIGGKYYAPYGPDPSFKPVRGASLPDAQVTPLAVPKDTVTGTTGAVVAMVQPMIQYVPVPVPGPERVEYVPANPFIAAKTGVEMLQLQGLS